MGTLGGPINEAVFFLHNTRRKELKKFEAEFPELGPELRPGIIAGEADLSEGSDMGFAHAKADVMASALSNAAKGTSARAEEAARRIKWIRRFQITSEMLVLIGSSSIVGTLSLDGGEKPLTVAAIATFLAACGGLFVEHASRTINPNLGNIFDAFQNLHKLSRETEFLAKEIALAVKFKRGGDEMSELVGRGNEVMSRVNEWDSQLFAT